MSVTARTWFRLHSWMGLKLSIAMSFILVTGTLAVFSYELDWLLNPQMRVMPAAETQRVSWGALYDSARSAYPGAPLLALSASRDPWWAAQAVFNTPSGGLVRVWIDPYTAQYQGYTGWFNIQRFLRQAHRHLMMPAAIGIPLVTLFALPLMAALVTGLVVYKKFWRGFFKWPRFGRPARIWLGDLHRLGALWSIWFIVIIGLTSIWYLAEKSLGAAAPSFSPAVKPLPRAAAIPADFDGARLDRAVALARRANPDLQVYHISFPRRPHDHLAIQGQATALLVRDRANAVYIDPLDLTLTGSHRGEDLTTHQRLSELADPLHFGTWGGMAVRIVWFVFGVILSGLSVTGIYIYGLRVVSGPARSASQTAAQVVMK